MKLFTKTPLALAVVCAVTAHADDTAELDDVKVYGEKQEKNLQDIPTSVALITEDQIADSTIQNFNDVFARMANVSSLRGGNESLFAIRGISVQGLSDNPNSFTAGVYVDEVPLDNLSIRYGSMPLWDIQQIEVYRGPHSTLQGRNALNGAVIINTQSPTYEWSGKARAEYSSYNTSRLSVAGGGALIEDELAVRLSVDDHKSDGYIDNITRDEDDYAGFHRTTLRGKVLFEPKSLDQLSALLTLSKVDNDSGNGPDARMDDPFSFEALSNHKTHHDILTDTAALNVSWEFSDALTLTSVSTYAKDSYDRIDDFDSSAAPLGFIDQDGGSKSLSQEFRVNFNTQEWSGVAGIYYGTVDRDQSWFLNSAFQKERFQNSIVSAATSALTPAITQQLINNGVPEAQATVQAGQLAQVQAQNLFNATPDLIVADQGFDANYKIKNQAVFGEATWRPVAEWALTFGARYDQEKQDRDQTTITDVTTQSNTGDLATDATINLLLNGFEQTLQGAEKADTEYSAFLPKFAAQYYFSPELNVGFSAQKGYRAGGSSVSLLTSQVREFDPEFTWNYELSLRSQWLENRLLANANVFYTDWQDQQVDVSPSGDARDTFVGNTGKSILYGAELETVALITPTLEVFASVGYVETEYKKFTLQTSDGLQDYQGNEFLGAPNWTANVGTSYRHYDGWFVGGDANYSDEANLDHANERQTEARILLNAKVGYEATDWSVYLWGTNLADREYIVQSNLLDAPGTTDSVRPGSPRMIGLSTQVNF